MRVRTFWLHAQFNLFFTVTPYMRQILICFKVSTMFAEEKHVTFVGSNCIASYTFSSVTCHKSVEGSLAIGYGVNSTLVVDPTIRLPGFDVHQRQWSLLNCFQTGQGHCNACHKKWGFTDNELCDCGETQTMSHIVNFRPLTKLDGGLLRLHEADEAAVDWLTTYGS